MSNEKECELREVKFIDNAPRRPVDWTEGQKDTAAHLLSWAIRDCAETSRRETTYLMVGDRHVQVKYRDVTEELAAVRLEDFEARKKERAP